MIPLNLPQKIAKDEWPARTKKVKIRLESIVSPRGKAN